MKIGMTALDIMACVQELEDIVGARVDKVYELDGIFLLRLYLPGKGRQDLLIEPGRRGHLTALEYRAPQRPKGYAMLLRKHLENARLVAVGQPRFERILELRFRGREERLLIAELFGEGNLILCDGECTIIQPYRAEVWRHRALKPGEKYAYPPRKGIDIREMDLGGLRKALSSAPDVVRGLATNLNIGGQLAEEICARAKLSKASKPAELSSPELQSLLSAAKGLFSEKPSPCIVYEDDSPIDVLPFDFVSHLGRHARRFESFNQALDEYFSALAVQMAAAKLVGQFEREVEKLKQRLDEQRARVAELEARAGEIRRQADLIKIHHAQVDEALQGLMQQRHARGWQGAMEALKEARGLGEAWAGTIKAVDPRSGRVELELEGRTFALDIRLSAFDNASRLYNKYKKLAQKVAGAKEAASRTELELNELLARGAPEVAAPVARKRRRPRWFERFRWFISSDGTLVIAGRDAATNQEVVEKHMQPGDRHLHADIHGAPHVVVKAEGKEVSEVTLREAAEFAAMHSRAWRGGLGSIGVYWALPEQVSKQAPSGQYLPKGSYVIRGKRNLLKVPVEAAVGVVTLGEEQVVMCGPPSAVKRHSRVVVRVASGRLKKSDLAREVKARLRAAGVEVSIDELMRTLPPGRGEIVESG